MKSTALAVTLVFMLCATQVHSQEKPLVVNVWPGAVPGEKGDIGPEKFQDQKPNEKKPVTRLTNVSKPTLTVFRPAKDKDTGAAVVICPGGGYNILA